MYFKLLLLFFLFLIPTISTSRILVALPFGAKSHFLSFETYINELANRNHNITVISPFPVKAPMKWINIETYTKIKIGNLDINISDEGKFPQNVINIIEKFDEIISYNTLFFKSSEIQELIKSHENFDLIITELFDTDALLIFSHIFKAPTIALSSCPILPWANSRFGNPDSVSYVPNAFKPFDTYNMNFYNRLINAVSILMYKLSFYYTFTETSQNSIKNYLNIDSPSLIELGKTTSLMLVNSHYTLYGSRPFVPNIIEVGGIHVKPAQKLPQDLEKFINESSHGVIYFCMGSMLKASTLPEEKRLDLIEVFSKLPQRVLWKWETETMPDKPDNVKLLKWMPQRDVLAHPNIKIFISHGGLLGTTEAVYSGVPIIGMPFYGDQAVNVEAVQAAGAGIRLDFKNLNKETLENAIRRILDDPKYKENAKQLSERFRDRPQSPLETAIYWTEYVIRHKGAPHLRSAAVDLTWYQYLLLDVVAFIIFILIVTVTILYYSIKFIYNLINKVFSKPQKNEKRSKHKDD